MANYSIYRFIQHRLGVALNDDNGWPISDGWFKKNAINQFVDDHGQRLLLKDPHSQVESQETDAVISSNLNLYLLKRRLYDKWQQQFDKKGVGPDNLLLLFPTLNYLASRIQYDYWGHNYYEQRLIRFYQAQYHVLTRLIHQLPTTKNQPPHWLLSKLSHMGHNLYLNCQAALQALPSETQAHHALITLKQQLEDFPYRSKPKWSYTKMAPKISSQAKSIVNFAASPDTDCDGYYPASQSQQNQIMQQLTQYLNHKDRHHQTASLNKLNSPINLYQQQHNGKTELLPSFASYSQQNQWHQLQVKLTNQARAAMAFCKMRAVKLDQGKNQKTCYVFQTDETTNHDHGLQLDPWQHFVQNLMDKVQPYIKWPGTVHHIGLTYHDLHEIFVSLERSQLLNDKQRKCRSQLINRNYWRFFQDTTTMYYQELVQTLTANRDLTAKQQDAIARAYRQYREHHYTNLSMHRKSNSAPQIPNWQYLIYAATMVENYRQANHQQKIIIQEAGYGHKRTNTAFMEAAALYCEIRGFPYQLYSHNDFLSINSSRGCTHAEIKDSNSEQWSEIADHHARHQQRLQEKASYLFHYAPEILNQLINFEAECTNQRSTPLYAHVDNQALFAQPS